MPKKFFKKRTCSECGTPGLFPKKSWKLMKRQGMTAVCTKCRTTIYLALKYSTKRKIHVIFPEYPHTTTSA